MAKSKPINRAQLTPEVIQKLRSIFTSEEIVFSGLDETSRNTLEQLAQELGLTGQELFDQIHQHPDLIEEKEVGITSGAVDLNILSANIAAMADQQAIVDQIKAKYKNLSEKDLERLTRIAVHTARLRMIAEYAKKATPQTKAQLELLSREINPKKDDPQTDIAGNLGHTAQALVENAIISTGVTFQPDEIVVATRALTNLIIANELPLLSADTEQITQIIEVSLAATGNQEFVAKSPTAQLYHVIDQSIQSNQTTLNEQGVPQTQKGQTVLNKDFVIIIPDDIPDEVITQSASVTNELIQHLPAPILDKLEDTTRNLPVFVSKVSTNPITNQIITQISQSLTQEQIDQFVHAVNATPGLSHVFIRSFPTKEAKQAEAVASLSPGNPLVDPKAIPVFSMGLTSQTLAAIYKHAAENPTSPIAAHLAKEETKKVITALNHSIPVLSNPENKLATDLNPRFSVKLTHATTKPPTIPSQTLPPDHSYQVKPPSNLFGKIGQGFQQITNRLSGFIPPSIGKYVNVIFHPVQFIQSRIGAFLGQRITSKLKSWAAQKVAGVVAKKVGTEVAKKVLEQGLKLLVKEGLKKGIEAALVSTGVGAIAAPLVEAVFWLGEKVLGTALKVIGGMIAILTGDAKPEEILGGFVATPLMVASGVGLTLGSATAVAASSAAVILMGSTFVGFILYISVIGIAPIISSIAHLESAEGSPYSVVAGGVVPEGCPSGWPSSSGRITQGPRTTSTHRGVEAIDIGIPDGSVIITTHNGTANYVSSTGPYGNYVDVTGMCNNITFTTRYAHLLTGAFVGMRLVSKGQVIGYSDNTGNSTGPHLHYEIRGGNLGDINQFLPKYVAPGCVEWSICKVSAP